MLSSANVLMGLAGLVFLIAGIIVYRIEFSVARGWDKLITLAPVFIAVSLGVFAPEHFRGPEFVQNMVPSWMPGPHRFWAYFVGCALLAAATSLALKKFVRLSSSLLGLMFLLFVCMIYLPSLLKHLDNRFAWIFFFRDLSFSAGTWSLAALYNRTASPRAATWIVLCARIAIGAAAIFYGAQHFLHPQLAPGVPSEMKTPSWVPLPTVYGYLTGLVLAASGIGLILKRKPRLAATAIGAWMTVLTLFPYLVLLILARDSAGVNLGLNYVADTLLYAGATLALALALPPES